MKAGQLPNVLQFAEYWWYSEEEKFALHEKVMDEATCRRLRKRFAVESIHARNREFWKQCEAKGIRASDIQEYFGGDTDHIRRSISDGKGLDQHLWYAMEIAGLDPTLFLFGPRSHHQLCGRSRAVEGFCHQSETEEIELSRLTQSPQADRADAARLPVNRIDRMNSALLHTLCRDESVLNEWLSLAVPVANEFSLLIESLGLDRFLKMIYGEAVKLIDPNDSESIALLESWAPGVADPAVVLGQIAEAWNPYQLYWHFALDETKF